jgi:hypothetical protein
MYIPLCENYETITLVNVVVLVAKYEWHSTWKPEYQEPYERVSKSFRTGRLERELQMVQLSATRCSCIAILWVNLVNFAAITLCSASQQVFIVVVISLSTQSGNFWIHLRIWAVYLFLLNGSLSLHCQPLTKSLQLRERIKYLCMIVYSHENIAGDVYSYTQKLLETQNSQVECRQLLVHTL